MRELRGRGGDPLDEASFPGSLGSASVRGMAFV